MSRDPVEEALFVDRGGFEPEPASSAFVALQRVVVRMLFDPDFVNAVYDEPDRAIGDLNLDKELFAQLVRNDRRLWSADRLRRSRALKILIDEFKVSTTLALLECRRLAFLDAFFSSPQFHDAVQNRGYMAVAFVAYLEAAIRDGKLSSAALVAVLRLESEMACSRRLLRDARRGRDFVLCSRRVPGSYFAPCPGVGGVIVPGGTLALVNHIEKYLFEVGQVPALVLCEDPPSPAPLPPLDEREVDAFLLEPQPGGKVDLSGISATFVHVIRACARGATAAELASSVREHGIAAEDAIDYAGQLVEGEVLRRIQVATDGAVSVAT